MAQQELFRLHAFLDGRVQGVGFRYFVMEKASMLGVTGWVRNTYAGKVEVLAEGDRSELEDLLIYLKRGPQAAFVSDVQIEWDHGSGQYSAFDIRATL
jgi:acylphosphatase